MVYRSQNKIIRFHSVRQDIPMNHLGRESCSAEASTIPVFHLHCLTIGMEPDDFDLAAFLRY